MSLTNKVAQFDADSDLVNAWVHGPASGTGSTVTTDSGALRTPAKLIDDKNIEINQGAESVLALSTAQANISIAQAGIATTQAELATSNGAAQVTLATAQVTLATTEKTAALAAKVAAELAAVNALISAGSYATEAEGRAAVADGVAFKVQGSGDVAAYEYRRTNSATSVLIAIYPSAAVITAIQQMIFNISDPRYAAIFQDAHGRIAAAILNDGTFKVKNFQAIDSIGGSYSPDLITMDSASISSWNVPGYIYTVQDAAGRIAFGIKTTGEVVIGKITALETDIPTAQITTDVLASLGGVPWYIDPTLTKSYDVGDSTVAAYAGGTALIDLLSSIRVKAGLAVPGQTIAQQKTVWVAASVNPNLVGYVVVQIGLNDLDPAESAATAIARLQDLISTVRATVGRSKPILIAQMIPCKQRLIDVYGAVNGLVSQQKWVDMNAAIAGTGPTPVTGVDGRITSHVALMGDGAGNLAATYDTGDHIHPNTAGRTVNATAWINSLLSLGIRP